MREIKINVDKYLSESEILSQDNYVLTIVDIYNMSLIYYLSDNDEYISYLEFPFNDEMLEEQGFIKILGDGKYSLRNRGMKLFSEDIDDFIKFAQNFINIFPEGVKSGGYYVRSDVESVVGKLRKFMKKYKYTQYQVLDATQRYIDRLSKSNYQYIKTASYFIFKDGVSVLASEIENDIKEGISDWTRHTV